MITEQPTAPKQELVQVTAPTTDPYAKGMATSEGKITLSTVVVSLAVAVFSQVAPIFEQASATVPQSPWLHTVATVVGFLAAASTALGYAISRASLKKAQIASEA